MREEEVQFVVIGVLRAGGMVLPRRGVGRFPLVTTSSLVDEFGWFRLRVAQPVAQIRVVRELELVLLSVVGFEFCGSSLAVSATMHPSENVSTVIRLFTRRESHAVLLEVPHRRRHARGEISEMVSCDLCHVLRRWQHLFFALLVCSHPYIVKLYARHRESSEFEHITIRHCDGISNGETSPSPVEVQSEIEDAS